MGCWEGGEVVWCQGKWKVCLALELNQAAKVIRGIASISHFSIFPKLCSPFFLSVSGS